MTSPVSTLTSTHSAPAVTTTRMPLMNVPTWPINTALSSRSHQTMPLVRDLLQPSVTPAHWMVALLWLTISLHLWTPLISLLTWSRCLTPVSYTHLRAHETRHDLVCRLLLE